MVLATSISHEVIRHIEKSARKYGFSELGNRIRKFENLVQHMLEAGETSIPDGDDIEKRIVFYQKIEDNIKEWGNKSIL